MHSRRRFWEFARHLSHTDCDLGSGMEFVRMQNSDVSPSVAVSSLEAIRFSRAPFSFRIVTRDTRGALRNFEILSLATEHDKTNDKFARCTYTPTRCDRVHARARCAFMREWRKCSFALTCEEIWNRQRTTRDGWFRNLGERERKTSRFSSGDLRTVEIIKMEIYRTMQNVVPRDFFFFFYFERAERTRCNCMRCHRKLLEMKEK